MVNNSKTIVFWKLVCTFCYIVAKKKSARKAEEFLQNKRCTFKLTSFGSREPFELTNRMWFSVVCTLIDNDTRHHSGQNVVDSRGAAE